jgi:acyl-CoA thioesterase I
MGDLARGDVHAPVAALGELGIVGDEDEGRAALAVHLEEQVDDLLAGLRIEVARGLVGEEEPRFGHEGACEGDALLLAPGELARIVSEPLGEPHAIEHAPRARFGIGPAVQFEGQHHVLQGGQRGQELERLENEAHHLPAKPRASILGEREEVLARDPHAPGARNVEAREQSEEGGLAGSRSPDDRHGLGRAHLEARVLHNGEHVVGGRDLFGETLRLHNDRELTRWPAMASLNRIFPPRIVHAFLWRALLLAVLSFAPAAAMAARTVMVFGDSLSSAYNLSPAEGWVHLIEERIAGARLPWSVVNASITGETTAGGLRRLAEDLKRHNPSVVVIELGGNDALRGQPVAEMRSNLERMVRLVRAARAVPVLVGIMIPPNYGIDYAAQFRDMYPQIAARDKLALVPFLLEGIDKPELFQRDQLHPTAEAQARIADNVWAVLEPVLRKKSP